MSSEANRVSPRQAGAVMVLVATVFAVATAYIAQANLDPGPIRLPYADRIPVQVFVPEGWKFFTKNPRDQQLATFVRDGSTWRRLTEPNSAPSNAFGIDRAGRALSIEAALLLADVGKDRWEDCKYDAVPCLESDANVVTVSNRSPQPTMCGAIGIRLQPPIPWAWAANKKPIVMPSRVLRLEVKC
jgi:antimicrobial peptide system SdpA family protein